MAKVPRLIWNREYQCLFHSHFASLVLYFIYLCHVIVTEA